MEIILIAIPFLLTALNIVCFIYFLKKKAEKQYIKILEVIGILLGMLYLWLYIEVTDIKFVNWDVQLYNSQQHSIISPSHFPTILAIAVVAFAGYLVVRFIPANKQSPIITAFGISAIYLGIGICVVWCIQTLGDFAMPLYAANCILVFLKTVYIIVYQKNTLVQKEFVCLKFKKLAKLLNTATNLPWVALLLVIPLLGVLVVILFLFGQEPSSIIKAWTDTADWTLSQKTAPPNVYFDEHYLCTVAAGGHRRIVKPVRGGMRHGHRVTVNRQLCVANAFEQVLEEKVPRFHAALRKFYDTVGYPISRHIRSKYMADFIYLMMKPLELVFLIVIYTVDVHPENRIAVQYPHAAIPENVVPETT